MVLVGLVSPPGLQMATFSLCPCMTFPLYLSTSGVSSSYNDSGSIGLASHPLTSFKLGYILKVPSTSDIED